MPYCDLVLNRRFPAPLENRFLLGAPDYSDRACLAFRRAISCSDIRLASDDLSYELYAPNHFALQFGLIQLVSFPLYDAWNYNTSWHRIDYDQWWSEVSVNCWGQRDDELFATIFEELRYPYDADTELLARFPEAEARPPLPEQAPRPARAPCPVQAGIIIHEPPQEGSMPPSGCRVVDASPAIGQAKKKKVIATEPEVENSSSDDDDPQTIAAALALKRSHADPQTDPWAEDEPVADRLVRRRSSRQVGEGSSAPGEGVSGSQTKSRMVLTILPLQLMLPTICSWFWSPCRL
ncbi:uncharacterized protein LOC121052849 [Rosa chinensis]|uniref:uncharacterized protein LOC121052849 n=1 Tax=Rosa chinensis TaxID=74649 RepID=UPI001AD8D60C|nr:uncharacterized protein LOC121052849 [Rosa chinensis]